MHPLEGGSDLARDPLGAGLADAAVGRHVGGEVAHGGVLGGEHVVPVRLKGGKREIERRDCVTKTGLERVKIATGNERGGYESGISDVRRVTDVVRYC